MLINLSTIILRDWYNGWCFVFEVLNKDSWVSLFGVEPVTITPVFL